MIKRTRKNGGEVFLFDDLNPEDAAMCQALLCRDAAGIEPSLERVYSARRAAFQKVIDEHCSYLKGYNGGEVVVDALMDIASHNDASAPARKVHTQYTTGFGHKSIADCGSSTLVFKGISMLGAKALEDWPLFSGEELSTRAVDMTQQPMIDPLGTPESRAILDRWISFYAEIQAPVAAEVRRRYPRRPQEDEKAYEGAVKYRTFDVTRAFLPAASTTNASLHMNLRQHGDKMPWLLHHPLDEGQDMGLTGQGLLCERYPSSGTFGGGAAVSGVGTDGKEDERLMWNRATVLEYTYPKAIRPGFRFTIGMLDDSPHNHKDAIESRPRGCVLPHVMSDMGQLQFGLELDFGSFRDLQRHRNGVCRMPLLTTAHGFETWYLDQLPADVREKADALILEQTRAIKNLPSSLSIDPRFDRQYYIAMGFKVPCSVTMGLPAFLYLAELRSSKTVHPTLRAKMHWMVERFQSAFPDIRMHIDHDPDGWDVRRGTQTIEKKTP